MSNLTFEPLISPSLWVALAVVSGALWTWYAWSRPASIRLGRWRLVLALSGLGLALLLLILLNPTWLETIPPPAGKPVLTALADCSQSMRVSDFRGKRRFDGAVEMAGDVAQALASRFDVELRSFGDDLKPCNLAELRGVDPDASSTDLAGVLSGALAVDHPQGHALLLLSDGIDNGPGGISALREALRAAKAMNVPVYTSTFGGETRVDDLEVVLARPQELAFVGQNVPVTAVVRQRGRLTDSVEVALLHRGEPVSQQRVPISPDGEATAHLQVRQEQTGLYDYEVRVTPAPQETTPANNSATLLLRVVDQPVRVVLLEGKPYWDGKFLVRALAADPALDIAAIVRVSESRFLKRSLRLPPIEKTNRPADANTDEASTGKVVSPTQAADPPATGSSREPDSIPARRIESTSLLTDPAAIFEGPQGLSSAQILVLGRDTEVFLSDDVLERLRTWISRDGGSLVCFRGSPVAQANQQLARMLPVRWTPGRESRFRVRLTERGQEADWLAAASFGTNASFESLPSLATVATPERPKPLSVVLATSEKEAGNAIVTYQPYGTGRVVAIEGAGMWRWAFLSPQHQQQEQIYASLWQGLLHWLISGMGLVPGQDLALRTDRVTYATGESASATLLTRESAVREGVPSVELLREGQAQGETFAAVPSADEPGVFRITFGSLPEGRYSARVNPGTKPDDKPPVTTAFEVRPNFTEQLDVQARPELMSRIAEETGGLVLNENESGRLASSFEELLTRNRPERTRRETAWDRWWVLVGIVLIWGSAWGLRRAAGLL